MGIFQILENVVKFSSLVYLRWIYQSVELSRKRYGSGSDYLQEIKMSEEGCYEVRQKRRRSWSAEECSSSNNNSERLSKAHR